MSASYRRKFTRRRRRSTGAWIYLVIVVLVIIGAVAGHRLPSDSPVVRERIQQCEPLVWTAGMDTEGWRLLIEQGYTERGDDGMSALYPPGCEGVDQ